MTGRERGFLVAAVGGVVLALIAGIRCFLEAL